MAASEPKISLDDTLKEIEGTITEAPAKAYKRLSPLLREYPSHSRVLTLFAHANVLMDNYEAAKSYAAKAVMLDGSNVRARHILGFCHQRLSEFPDAVRVYTQIIKAAPTSATAHLFLGDSLSKCGYRDEAIEAYRKAAALDEGGDVGRLAEEAVLKLKGAR
jgi:tetratricopeptide (TPR) repeat protein